MKYISTQRPLVPGAFPKPKDNPVLNITNFDEKSKVFQKTEDGIRTIMAWGIIEYKKPLWKGDADAYELTPIKE